MPIADTTLEVQQGQQSNCDTNYLETNGSHELLRIIFQSDTPCEAELTKQLLDFYTVS